MGLKCGIVGLPNVGKSTLFNALTKNGVQAENYPFCTIEPNSGLVNVPDPRLTQLSKMIKTQKTIPAAIEFVDIAGLVKGASKGEGLGNQFLANIRETDAIIHVVRGFEDHEVVHVNNHVDPITDIEVINYELMMADLEALQKQHSKLSKQAKTGDKQIKKRLQLIELIESKLEAGVSVRAIPFSEEDQMLVKQMFLLTVKPVLYVVNVEEDWNNNVYFQSVLDFTKNENAIVLPLCNKLEADLAELTEADQMEMLKDFGMEEPGLNRTIRAAYSLLNLQTYFTAGPKEIRAWTIPVGSKAPQAAGVIHSDFERGFIRAEVMGFNDYITYGSEQAVKEAGKLRIEGKEYVVQDGDMMNFRFNV